MRYSDREDDKNRCSQCKWILVRPNDMGRRCMHPDNLYTNWMGLISKVSAATKNHNGRCKEYEEIMGSVNSDSDELRSSGS